MNVTSPQKLQILRCIDKADRLGIDAVVKLLQKPLEEFGANLDPIRAGLIGQFMGTMGKDSFETLDNLKAFFIHSEKVMRRRIDGFFEPGGKSDET